MSLWLRVETGVHEQLLSSILEGVVTAWVLLPKLLHYQRIESADIAENLLLKIMQTTHQHSIAAYMMSQTEA